MRRTITRGLYTWLALLLLFSLLPVQAVQAAENNRFELILKAGSSSASVNGTKITIAKPYSEKGTVMVPLGVFKKTFGSTVALEGDNVVKVMYRAHTGAMTIGETIAWKDGVKVKLPAAPRMVSGVLMVPLRFVAGVIGAAVSVRSSGEIVLSLVAPDEEVLAGEDQGIDSDVGKTKIGNSYYRWSMNYPAGLIVGDSGGEESVATFMSAENTYYLEVHVTLQEVKADPDELLEQLVRSSEEGGEIVLDRQIYPNAKVPYAMIISKDSSGALWEGRQYYAEGRLYELYLTDDNAVNYKDFAKYSGLLNSFQPSFDEKDRSIRDLSTVENGFREAVNEDYGISLDIPAEWSIDNRQLYFESRQGSSLKLKVSTASAGSTLASWGEERKAQLEDSFVPDAYHLKESTIQEIAGVKAQVNQVEYNYGNGWATEYQMLLLNKGYRYYAQFTVPAGQEKDAVLFKPILSSLDIDYDVIKENFGRLAEDSYLTLKDKTVTKISKTFDYVIDIPLLWTPYQDIFEMQNIEYRFTGGRFQLAVNPEGSVEYTVNQLKDFYGNKGNDPKGPVIENIKQTTLAGEPATEIMVHLEKGGSPCRIQTLVFSKGNAVYTLTVTLNDYNATPVQLKTLEETLQSFRFRESR
ncbi:stalk domain-containing protein [Paenibacillus sp. sgz500958]|uniref:stalk domain-containing protein n=1 Tax=Paenibacillus sp. sgz500958 TaxID=3242475 RepID=UPI0036D278F7